MADKPVAVRDGQVGMVIPQRSDIWDESEIARRWVGRKTKCDTCGWSKTVYAQRAPIKQCERCGSQQLTSSQDEPRITKWAGHMGEWAGLREEWL